MDQVQLGARLSGQHECVRGGQFGTLRAIRGQEDLGREDAHFGSYLLARQAFPRDTNDATDSSLVPPASYVRISKASEVGDFEESTSFKERNASQMYIVDSLPMATCDNIRIRCCRLYPSEESAGMLRGYVPSKQRNFYGLQVHVVVSGLENGSED